MVMLRRTAMPRLLKDVLYTALCEVRTPLASRADLDHRARPGQFFPQTLRLVLEARAAHERIGGHLAGLYPGLVEGVDAVELARERGLELEQIKELAQHALGDPRQQVREAGTSRGHQRDLGAAALGPQQLAQP